MFDDVRFPENLSYGAEGGPVFSTSLSISKNGNESRNINRQIALAQYKINPIFLSYDQLSELISFFRSRMGMAIGFLFKDWSDFKGNMNFHANKETAHSFPLIKKYVSGQRTYTRTISKPVKSSIKLSINGTNSIFTVEDNGMITLNEIAVAGSEININFEFDVPVRFNSDKLILKSTKRNSWSYENIVLTEIKI